VGHCLDALIEVVIELFVLFVIDAYFSVEEISFFDWVSNVLEVSQLGLVFIRLGADSISIDPCDCSLDLGE
jgi:hypothetical protein